ncbi:MAG: MarR family transcriptional regulator [Bacteroidetes bacterium CG12_big_fil_rev_8_21_14_0_65_60_17]|nr:MAG: MarR family transcriptional regulator [Bacteroidetes bacterium CG12_big_fil_rev_8_21_14_0_65_60_17]
MEPVPIVSTLHALQAAHGRWMAVLAETLQEFNLTTSQWGVLRVLLGAYPEPLTCTDVGCRLLERMPDTTRLLVRLERRGLIDRVQCTEDRRIRRVSLTETGLAVATEVATRVDEAEQELLSGLDPDEQDTLITLLDQIG